MVSNLSTDFSKKDPINGLALSQNLKNGVCRSHFAEGVLFLWSLQGNLSGLSLFSHQIYRVF